MPHQTNPTQNGELKSPHHPTNNIQPPVPLAPIPFHSSHSLPLLPFLSLCSHSSPPSATVPCADAQGSLTLINPISPICTICTICPIRPINKKPLEIPLEGLPEKNGGYLLTPSRVGTRSPRWGTGRHSVFPLRPRSPTHPWESRQPYIYEESLWN
ncbi:MAG: hypothetical protein IJJ73_06310 [Bacteroidaceae bacterium]|nr:hypothetical protein [Bacteroidaceae bacterium]